MNQKSGSIYQSLLQENKYLKAQVEQLRSKLEVRNKEILSLMKNEIIDLTNDEDYMLPEVKRKSLDEFIAWAFDEHEEVKEEEEVYYATPPTKKLKF